MGDILGSEELETAGSRFFMSDTNCLPSLDMFKEFSDSFSQTNEDVLPTGSGMVLHAQTRDTITQIEPSSSLSNNGSLIDLIYDETSEEGDRVWQLSTRLQQGQYLTDFGLPTLPEWNKSPCIYQIRITKNGAVNGFIFSLNRKGTQLEHTRLGVIHTQQVAGVVMELGGHKISQDKIEERRSIRQRALAELSRVCLEQTLPLTSGRVTTYHAVRPSSLDRSIIERENYLAGHAGLLPHPTIPLQDENTALTTVVMNASSI